MLSSALPFVLLDLKFYHSKMKPLIVQWCLGWLQHHFVGRCSVNTELLAAYLMGIQKKMSEKDTQTFWKSE